MTKADHKLTATTVVALALAISACVAAPEPQVIVVTATRPQVRSTVAPQATPKVLAKEVFKYSEWTPPPNFPTAAPMSEMNAMLATAQADSYQSPFQVPTEVTHYDPTSTMCVVHARAPQGYHGVYMRIRGVGAGGVCQWIAEMPGWNFPSTFPRSPEFPCIQEGSRLIYTVFSAVGTSEYVMPQCLVITAAIASGVLP